MFVEQVVYSKYIVVSASDVGPMGFIVAKNRLAEQVIKCIENGYVPLGGYAHVIHHASPHDRHAPYYHYFTQPMLYKGIKAEKKPKDHGSAVTVLSKPRVRRR